MQWFEFASGSLKYAKDFIEFSEIDLKSIDIGQLYGGNSIDELKIKTSYMNKNIDYIGKKLDDGSIEPPLFLRKNGELKILGGRTRSSICRINGKDFISAYVVDYNKMKKYFSDLMIKDFIQNGYDIFSFSEKRDRQKFILDLKYGSFEFGSVKKLEIFKGMSDENIFNVVENCCDYVFGLNNIKIEKNEFGLRDIEKVISIIPNGMSKDGIYKYLELNNVSKEDIRDTSFYSVIENDIFINPIKNASNIDKDSSYWNNKGEIESREIEDKYISLSSIIKIDDSIENMSDSEIKDMLTRLAYDRVDVELV